MQHLHWRQIRVSGLQLTYLLGLQKKLNLNPTLMPAENCLDNTFIVGMAAEKVFVVEFQLVG